MKQNMICTLIWKKAVNAEKLFLMSLSLFLSSTLQTTKLMTEV